MNQKILVAVCVAVFAVMIICGILILIDEGQYTFFGMGKLSDGTYYLRATAEDELNVDIKFCPFCGRKLV